MKTLNRKNSRSNRLSKNDKRSLVKLIREHGLKGASKVWQKMGNGYVSTVTLWKIKNAANARLKNQIDLTRGRPTTEDAQTFKRYVRTINVD